LSNDKDKIKKYYGEQFEQTLIQIADKAISPNTIIKLVYGIISKKPVVSQDTNIKESSS
jgi:hypothetical protein